jgi:hypothetical protein
MKRIMILALSVVAALAMMVSIASAEGTGPKVTLRTAKGALVKGQNIVASSSNLVFTTSAGNLECSSNIITGFVKTNTREKPSGEITKEESTGNEVVGAKTNLCKTTTPFGPAEIIPGNLNWKIKFTNKGVVQINSNKGNKTVSFTSIFPAAGGATCTFQSKKVLSSFPVSTSPVPLVITTSNQIFKLNKEISTEGCPVEGKLNGSFSTTSNGEAVQVEVK